MAAAYENGSDADQEYVQNVAMFLTSFLMAHLKLIEKQDNNNLLLLGHMYLIKVSKVDDREVFKTCLEYWTKLVSELYNELPLLGDSAPLMLNTERSQRRMLYTEVLSQLRLVMTECMVKPEEVCPLA